jgi:tetratricopeptide (TPR) repeat protein
MMRARLHRLMRASNRVLPIKNYVLFGLVAWGVLWLCATEFRKKESARRRYGRSLPRMVWMIGTTIMRSRNALPRRFHQIYISQQSNSFRVQAYAGSWFGRFHAPFLLFIANALKVAGLFDLAATTYRLVESAGFKVDLALAGLGDLFLVEASWSEEAQAHLAAGVLLDSDRAACLKSLTHAWTMRPFSDAVDVLRRATSVSPDNRVAWWLLVSALLKARRWDDAADSLRRYLELAPSQYEQNIAAAVAE